jgi:hypothetical protein
LDDEPNSGGPALIAWWAFTDSALRRPTTFRDASAEITVLNKAYGEEWCVSSVLMFGDAHSDVAQAQRKIMASVTSTDDKTEAMCLRTADALLKSDEWKKFVDAIDARGSN